MRGKKKELKKIIAAAGCALFLLCGFAGCAEEGGIEWPPKNPETVVDWNNDWPAPEPLQDSSFSDGKLVWQDEFNGGELNAAKWVYDEGNGSGGWGNEEKQYYKSENVRVSGGKLQIIARYEKAGGCFYTSGKIMTRGKYSVKYGRIEARIKLPGGEGFWPAFWMMPADNVYGGWPASGEIDIMEAKGSDLRQAYGTVHFGSAAVARAAGDSAYFKDTDLITNFHVYAVEWREGSISFFADGRRYFTVSAGQWYTAGADAEENPAAPFDQNFFLILNLAVGGKFDAGRLPPTSAFAALMEVDYVRVFDLG
jgi:beta-glucanase (GH16 family)